ncbi:hypothetical protein V7S43_008522 [Phytophthora oleae]|uniref:Uncharacterized protein n=1 Tax=Phytophthora oleae TaxID=2107226 RepID=A0ABD3FIZ1_9STRA
MDDDDDADSGESEDDAGGETGAHSVADELTETRERGEDKADETVSPKTCRAMRVFKNLN